MSKHITYAIFFHLPLDDIILIKMLQWVIDVGSAVILSEVLPNFVHVEQCKLW